MYSISSCEYSVEKYEKHSKAFAKSINLQYPCQVICQVSFYCFCVNGIALELAYSLRLRYPNTCISLLTPMRCHLPSQFLLLLCEQDSIRVSLFFKVQISQHTYPSLNPNAMSFAKSVFSALM